MSWASSRLAENGINRPATPTIAQAGLVAWHDHGVLNLSLAGLSIPSSTGPIGPDDQDTRENGPVSGAGSWAGNGQANGTPAHETAAAGTSGQLPAAVGPEMGRLGRLHTEKDGTAGKNNPEQQAHDWGDWQ